MEEVNGVEAGLMQDAQRFFVLTQTDNLWKEHLQAIKFVQQVITAGFSKLLQALVSKKALHCAFKTHERREIIIFFLDLCLAGMLNACNNLLQVRCVYPC